MFWGFLMSPLSDIVCRLFKILSFCLCGIPLVLQRLFYSLKWCLSAARFLVSRWAPRGGWDSFIRLPSCILLKHFKGIVWSGFAKHLGPALFLPCFPGFNTPAVLLSPQSFGMLAGRFLISCLIHSYDKCKRQIWKNAFYSDFKSTI